MREVGIVGVGHSKFGKMSGGTFTDMLSMAAIEALDDAGFRERIVIGMYGKGRIYCQIDFSDELANGLISMALVNEDVHQGLIGLASNLEAILEGVRSFKPGENDAIH